MHLYVSCYCEIKTKVSEDISAVNVTALLLALVVIYSTSSPHVITCTNKTLLCVHFDTMQNAGYNQYRSTHLFTLNFLFAFMM